VTAPGTGAIPADRRRSREIADAPVIHLTIAERAALGRAARGRAARGSQSTLDPPSDRDPIARLEADASGRVAELLPIRYGRMLSSPLAFFRGAAVVMASDLSGTPRAGLNVQLCGDAHLLNFGGFASPERDLVFDVNDFDETLPGPFEWDVKRLAASVEIAARGRGFASAAPVLGAVRAYRETMRQLADAGELDVWYSHADAASLAAELSSANDTRGVKAIKQIEKRARTHDTAHAVVKLTRLVDGALRFVSNPPLIVPIGELADGRHDLETELRADYRAYRRSLERDRRVLLERYRYGDLAHKVVGIGSVGTRCWVLLLLGKDERDPLLLQLKEARASVLEPSLGRSGFANHARRVVEGQRLCQAASDIFLGWTRVKDRDGTTRDFYVRQLRDWKISLDIDRIPARGLATYAQWCGATLARAHARSGDPVAIAAYLGKTNVFDVAVASFATAYADLNEVDHASLRQAVEGGRIQATST
jgi:uncharacterized protein (DUF2252 family)